MLENYQSSGVTRRTFSRLALAAGISLFIPMAHPLSASALSGKSVASDIAEQAVLDDAGRSCIIKLFPEKLIPSGKYAETVLMALCPERLLSKATNEKNEIIFSGVDVNDLPGTGRLFVPGGEESSIDIVEIEELSPDLIVDIGDYKKGHSDILDGVMRAVEAPTLFVDASFGNLSQAIRTLGRYLSCEERADVLADKFEHYFDWVASKANDKPCRRSILFCEGDAGLSVRGKQSYQSLAIAAVGCQDAANYQGDSNSIDTDIETIMKWDPDFIVFSNEDCFEKINKGEGLWDFWSAIPAIQRGDYCLSPTIDSNWFGSPFFVQTIGMVWLWHITHAPDSLAALKEEIVGFYGSVFDYDIELSLIEESLSRRGVPHGAIASSNEIVRDEPTSPGKVMRVVVKEDGSVIENEI